MSGKLTCQSSVTYDKAAHSARFGLSIDTSVPANDRTVQSHRTDADINVILKRFRVTGVLPVGVRAPSYGDFTGVGDFRSAMDAILLARKSFAEMPAATRARFGNDPQLFVEFCSDKANLPEMRKMGLAIPEPPAIVEPPPTKVEIVNAPVAK